MVKMENTTRESIRFRGYLTFDDSLKVRQALKPRRRLPPAALITGATLAAAAVVLWRMRVTGLPALVLLAFLGTFMAIGFRILAASTRRSQERVYASACITRHGILRPDAILIRRGGTRKTIPWEHFDRTLVVDDLLALVNNRESLGFARYMFNTEGEWSRARERILSAAGRGRGLLDTGGCGH